MISSKDFEKINKALDIELYEWQKAYIQGDIGYVLGGRRNGNTLAYVLKQLLNYEHRVRFSNNPIKFYREMTCDRNTPKSYVNRWYIDFTYDIAMKLDNAGIETLFIFS